MKYADVSRGVQSSQPGYPSIRYPDSLAAIQPGFTGICGVPRRALKAARTTCESISLDRKAFEGAGQGPGPPVFSIISRMEKEQQKLAHTDLCRPCPAADEATNMKRIRCSRCSVVGQILI